MKYITLVFATILTACASSGSGASWSASSWNGLADRSLDKGNHAYLVSPYAGQGFKLKLTVKADLFGAASAPPPDADALEAAAIEAAPDGCTFMALERTEDGGAIADYDCT